MATLKTAPPVGTRVRLTGDFLRNTGQFAGGDCHSRWTTVACDCGLCKNGEFVATNEPHSEIKGRGRHINVHNLETCR